MKRNHAFAAQSEPNPDDKLKLERSRINGPFSFLNPTNAQYHHSEVPVQAIKPGQQSESDVSDDVSPTRSQQTSPFTFLWRSRDNRKGRHTVRINPDAQSDEAEVKLPKPTNSTAEIWKNTLRMFTVFKPWDISWLVAQIFVWGSVVWVINSFFAFLPLMDPSTEFNGESLYAGGITAFIGAIVFFETGSILLMIEAVNENNAGCFGWAVEKLVEGEEEKVSGSVVAIRPRKDGCTHHHQNKRNLIGDGVASTDEGDDRKAQRNWNWAPTWQELKTHYFHELGFLACLAQFTGATIFGISGFTALPGILNHLNQRVENGVFWVPQIVGGTGFIVSGILFMIETQEKWYKPAFGVLGWHIGFWNLVGALGFTLCGALGPAYGDSGAQFQSSCATFWGSWAFLVASVLQLYESVQKNPVEVAKS